MEIKKGLSFAPNTFNYDKKEKMLWNGLMKRARQGSITMSVTLQNFKLFCLTIRQKENYNEWLNSKGKYELSSHSNYFDENIFFKIHKTKPTVRVNKRTLKREYFDSIEDLADELCLSKDTVTKLIRENISKDGYTFHYAKDLA